MLGRNRSSGRSLGQKSSSLASSAESQRVGFKDVQQEVREELTFILAERIEEVLPVAFNKDVPTIRPDERDEPLASIDSVVKPRRPVSTPGPTPLAQEPPRRHLNIPRSSLTRHHSALTVLLYP